MDFIHFFNRLVFGFSYGGCVKKEETKAVCPDPKRPTEGLV